MRETRIKVLTHSNITRTDLSGSRRNEGNLNKGIGTNIHFYQLCLGYVEMKENLIKGIEKMTVLIDLEQ